MLKCGSVRWLLEHSGQKRRHLPTLSRARSGVCNRTLRRTSDWEAYDNQFALFVFPSALSTLRPVTHREPQPIPRLWPEGLERNLLWVVAAQPSKGLLGYQNRNLSPNSITRGGVDVDRIRPKPPAVTVETGVPRFTLLNRLKNSNRNCNW